MDPERHEKLKCIVADTLDLPIGERAGFLKTACDGDEALEKEAASLLTENDVVGEFLLDPVLQGSRMRPLPPGEILASRFEILRLIGQGGMGDVYAARDLQLGGKVALKTVRADIAADPDATALFKKEIQLAKNVTHPNVCRVYDLGWHQEGDVAFLTMELLEGETLATRLTTDKMSAAEALPIAMQMAAGLAAAHEAGVVHRDFKPANVMLAPGRRGDETRVAIMDFGLARPAGGSRGAETIAARVGILGSPDYMAPEQFTGNDVTAAADIFAFGVVLYEMVTGQRPFQAATFLESAVKRITEPPVAPSQLMPDLEPRWERAILRCLKPRPEERFQSALEVAETLSGTILRPASSRAQCPACRRDNPGQARFCEDCGAALRRSWVAGSSRDCHLVIPNPTVSGHHCRITESDRAFLVEDLKSRNGTFVNGRRIQEPTEVVWGVDLKLGASVSFPWDDFECARNTRVLRIGREADNDVVLNHSLVSAYHARITIIGDRCTIEDLDSTNGTGIGSPGNKITSAPLKPDDTVFFGSLQTTASQLLSRKVSFSADVHVAVSTPGVVVFGRDPKCERVLEHPMVSWRHARVLQQNSKYTIEDLNSTNGTFVNGNRISAPVAIKVGDVIGLGNFTFPFTGGSVFRERDYRGNVTLQAKNVTVDAPGRRLIEDISLTILPSEIVALMGVAGAGKTTLMSALNGYVRPTSGSVWINGQDLYKNFDRFRGQIGYSPQDDIMHRELTVSQALYYSAKLRLPADYDPSAIRKRVNQVLEMLAMRGAENVIIGSAERKGISGGQRKRVSLAMELLTDPDVLFLDEPTSGLSSVDAVEVMKLLRELADSGKTILLTIHQPGLEVFRMMDSLAIIGKDLGSVSPGKLVYFGPAYPEAVCFFNPNGVPGSRPGVDPSPDAILQGLATQPVETWLARFAESPYKKEYVDERALKSAGGPSGQAASCVNAKTRGPQWRTLVQRCLKVKIQDRAYTGLLLGQSLFVALLIVFACGPDEKPMAVFGLVMAALFSGCLNASREIVGEWSIYHRERMVNLSLWPYVASKLTVLGGLCILQCAILVGVIADGCKLRGDFLPATALLTLASMVALGYGLIISAISRTSERAVALILPILMPMLLLGGALPKLQDSTRAVAKLLPSRWAFEGMLQLQSLETVRTVFFPESDQFSSGAAACVLGFMVVALVTILSIVLKGRDVH